MKRHAALALIASVFAVSSLFTSLPVLAQDQAQVTLSGIGTEPNFVQKFFWLRTADKITGVRIQDATIKFQGQDANIYRLMGNPTVDVVGTMKGAQLMATSITITSGPRARLQRSSYTDQAVPPFGPGDLAPPDVTPSDHPSGSGASGTTPNGSAGHVTATPSDGSSQGSKTGAEVISQIRSETGSLGAVEKKGNKQWVVWRGIRGPDFALIGDSTVSPDGQRLAYEAMKDRKWLVVAGGMTGRGYDRIVPGSLGFSKDSKHTAYEAKSGSKTLVVVDGVPGRKFDSILNWSLAFSADSKTVSYKAREGKAWHTVVTRAPGLPH